MTRSHNANPSANSRNDEILVRALVDGSGLYEAYKDYFNTAWFRADSRVQSVGLADC